MKFGLLYIFIIISIGLKCQDKLFFSDGTTKTGKVTEVGPEQILIKVNFETLSFARQTIILIEFADGSFDIINTPAKTVTTVAAKKENFHFKQQQKLIYNYNQVYINSLALCNADIAAFYERILPIKSVGLGVMGAYNFNLNATFITPYISFLNNAKKNYDLGAFVNFYPFRFEKRRNFYFGVMVKYTSFNFTHIKFDTLITGNTISIATNYSAAKASQLATLVTFGTQRDITHNFFVKTIFGIGAFKLNGDYKEEYNNEINRINNNRNRNNANLHANFLPKCYFGINIGFKL